MKYNNIEEIKVGKFVYYRGGHDNKLNVLHIILGVGHEGKTVYLLRIFGISSDIDNLLKVKQIQYRTLQGTFHYEE